MKKICLFLSISVLFLISTNGNAQESKVTKDYFGNYIIKDSDGKESKVTKVTKDYFGAYVVRDSDGKESKMTQTILETMS